MKNIDRLALYGWPAAAVIILFSLLWWLLVLTNIKTAPAGPSAGVLAVKYTTGNNQEPIEPEEIAEIRAVYASDLFASARDDRVPVLTTNAADRLDPVNITASEAPLFLSLPPVAGQTGAQWFAITEQAVNDISTDSTFLPSFIKRSEHQGKKYPQLSVDLKGELKQYRIAPDIFRNLAPLAEGKPWSVQAEMKFNKEGFVDCVFAESADCENALYQEIIHRLYQCRLENVAGSCQGIMVISYPTYTTNSLASAVLFRGQSSGAK